MLSRLDLAGFGGGLIFEAFSQAAAFVCNLNQPEKEQEMLPIEAI